MTAVAYESMAPAHAIDLEDLKPPIPENLRPYVADAVARLAERPPNPGVQMRRKTDGRWSIEAPFDDHEAWEALIADAFGTRSHSMVWTFLNQLRGVVGRYHDGEKWRPDEFALTAALNLVATAKPQTELEAALVVQMVGIHMMQMRMAARALSFDELHEKDVSLAAKLARTYACMAESLAKLQGRVKQQEIKVTYERHEHRHLHDERHVHLPEGGVGKTGGQPYEPSPAATHPAGLDARGSTLPGPHPQGDAMPVAGEQGAEAMPAARRSDSQRRTDG